MMGPATPQLPQQVKQEAQRRELAEKTFIAPSVCMIVSDLYLSL